MILLSYDGSADARAAIDRAAQIMPGAEATVITVWEPFIDTMVRSGSLAGGMGMAGTYADSEKIDAARGKAALASATEGAERATAAGFVAQPRSESSRGDIASTILAAAAAVDADVIVTGTRGLGGLKSFLLGSVSHAIVQHADRAVMVVPSPGLAEHRRDWGAQDAPTA